VKLRTAIRHGAVLALLGTAGLSTAPALAGDPGNAYTLFQLTNQDRTSNGLGALAYSGSLSSIATSARGNCGGVGVNGRSQDLIERNYFSHQIPPCGGYVWQVFGLGAYTAAGENIGWNNYPPSQSVGQINTAFMNSPEHRANILGGYNTLGTGAWQATGAWSGAGGSYNGVIMYTEVFTNSPSGGGGAAPPPPPPPAPTRTVTPPRTPTAANTTPSVPAGTTPAGPGPTGTTPDQPGAADNPAPTPTPSIPSCPVPTDLGEPDRTSPAPTLGSDGGPAPCPAPNLVAAAPSAGPAVTRTTGTIAAGSDQLAVSSGSGIGTGDILTISGAGDAGADLTARVVSTRGTSITLDRVASTEVKDAAVVARPAAEVQGADREASRRGILETVVDQVLRLFLNV
jgi:uncharacterized protein YkwD